MNAGTYWRSTSGVSRSGSTVTKSTCNVRVGAQLFRDCGELEQGRRADVRTVRKAEEEHDDLALEIGERAALAVVVGELESLPEGRAGDVGQLELAAIAAARERSKRERQGERAERCSDKKRK